MNTHLFTTIHKNKPSIRILIGRAGRLLVFLALLLSLIGGPSSIAVKAAAGTISYLGNIGAAVSKTSGTSLVVTTNTAVSTGDDIIVAVATDPNSSLVVSVADPAGNTYNQVGYVVNSGNVRTYLFAAYNSNAMASGSSLTVTSSPAVTARAAVVSLFSGLDESSPLDQTKSGTGTGTSPSSGATATTTQDDELLIGVVGTEGPDGDAAGTWNASFLAGPRLGTTGGTADTNITVSLGYQIVSAAGAYTASKIGITSSDWGAMIATFKAGASGTLPTIRTTGTPLSAFSSVPGSPSTEKSYSVSGSNLTDAITITAPGDFEISLTSGAGFGTSLQLSPTDGTVAATPIFVRFNRASEGTSTGNITHTSSEATTRNVAVSGTAAPLNPVTFNILLGRPEDVSITANIIPDQDVDFYIEYGTSTGTYTTGQTATYTASANQDIELAIGSLTANTRYYYRIVYRRSGTTGWNNAAEHSFITQRPAGSSFTFTVTSDNHLGQYGGQTADELALWQQTLSNVAADHPDFHIDTGDTFPMDPSPLGTGMTDAEAKAAYLYDRPYLGAITDSIPYFQVLGNHENEEGWNFDDVFTSPDQSLALAGMKYRKLYYPNPIPDSFYSGNTDTSYGVIGGDTNQEDYWAWTWGDALFVAIDPFHYSLAWSSEGDTYGGEGQDGEIQGTRWDWSLGIQQYLWFKSVLENSHAKYKFVFAHQVAGGASVYGRGGQSASPFFEWGGENADGTWGFDVHRPASDGWTLPIHQLMVKNGVSVFFHGHDHDYARELVDGILYLECPKPDDAGYTWDPYSYGHNEGLYPNAIVELQNSGYFRVNVSSSETKVEYVRSYLPGDGTNGIVADSVTVPGTAPTSNQLIVDKAGPGSGTVTTDVSGIDCGSTCSAPFSTGASVTLTAAPASGSTFTGWEGDCTGTGTCQVAMNHTHVVKANFSSTGTTYSLTVNAGSNGSITTPAGTTTHNAGDVVTITASPNSGYHFVNWTGNWNMIAHTTGASSTITMNGNYTIQANFAANTSTSYSLTVNAGSGGTITAPSSSPSSYTSGTVVTLTASPNSGYHFVNWTGLMNTVADTKSASTTITMNGNYVLLANFAADTPSTFKVRDDYDGDGKTDAVKFVDGSGSAWWFKSSTSAWDGKWLGTETDMNYVGASDFDGDGKTDLAKYIPSTGAVWYYLSNTGTWDGKWLGAPSEAFTYVAGSDFDGDGKTDPAKFVPSTGAVWYLKSSTGTWDGKWLGPEALTYVTGSDFDGDGKTDPAKFVPSTKVLWYLGSKTGTWTGVYMGSETFSYVPASDFDGDGKTDPAKFIASTGVLWYLSSLSSSWVGVSLGTGTYTYIPGCDFNNDGKTEPAKYDESTHLLSWYNGSTWTDINMGSDTFTIGNGQ